MTSRTPVHRTRADVVILAIGATLFAVSTINAIASYAARLGVPLFDWTFYAGAVDRWLAGEQIYPGGASVRSDPPPEAATPTHRRLCRSCFRSRHGRSAQSCGRL